MRIGIEMRPVTLGISGGVAQLLRGVLRCLCLRHSNHKYVLFSTIFNSGLLQPLPGAVENHVLPLDNYFEQLDQLAKEKDLDVLFRGYPMSDNLQFPMDRQIFQIPDIQHEHYPEFFAPAIRQARQESFNQVLKRAAAYIGTISDFARQTLLAHEATRCRDIFLMSPALLLELQEAASEPLTESELGLVPSAEYLLYPGNLWPHKNHRRVLEAFAQFRAATGRNVELVLTGHPAGWNEVAAEFGALPIRHLGFVRPPLLRRLLEKARALVYFSLYEGFGMPLLEAFDAGTPVLCSNSTSLPEVGGDAILSCDPLDVEAMSRCMARITQDADLGQLLIQRGKERLKAYTWEAAADNLLAACHRVHAGQHPVSEPRAGHIHVESWPVVSIVTPSFNQGRFLRRTIDSVLTQSYPHVEFVVIDGGSTDESVDILKSYGARFPWVSERDRGQTHAINKGFSRTHGDIQAYLNSDDVLLPGAVEEVVQHMLRRPACDLVYGEAHYIDENDNITGRYNTADYSFARLMQDCCICQPAAFWRTSIARTVGAFDESLHFAMDYDYWMRVDRAGGLLEHSREFLACSRMYAENKTLSCRTKIYDEIFHVSMKNAGFASLSYFQGLWHHLCHERRSGWPRYLASVPRFPDFMASLHHSWRNGLTPTPQRLLRNFARAAKGQAKHHLGRRFLSGCRVAQSLAKRLLRPFGAVVGGAERFNRPAVIGFWPDNWLAPTLRVHLGDSAVEQDLHLIGAPPEATKLTVRLPGKRADTIQLQAATVNSIAFKAPAGRDRNLVLEFSQFHVDPWGRQLAFRLQETNIFGEYDLGRNRPARSKASLQLTAR